jgi:hypothetical protein
MNRELIMPLSLVLGLVAFGLTAHWYVMPWLKSVSRTRALTPLLLLHSFRYIGLAFLIPGVTAQALDASFANPAAYGDLLAAVLALIALIAVRLNWSVAMPLMWVFNIEGTEGTLDLLNALVQGVQRVSVGALGATYFIPTVAVPALLVTHFMMFVLLVRQPYTWRIEPTS